MASTMETVVDRVIAALAAVTTGTIYEPGAANVKALTVWPDEAALNSLGSNTVYLVRPGRETRDLPDSGTITGRLEVYILACRLVGAAGNQLQETPQRWRVAADLVSDVERKLNVAEAAKASPVLTYLDGPLEIDNEWDGLWAIPEIRIRVRYRKELTDR